MTGWMTGRMTGGVTDGVTDGTTGGRSGVVARVLAALVALPLAGALAGVLWEWVWRPPTGVVVDGQWLQDPVSLGADFSATGWYVVLAVAIGTVVAGLLVWLLPGHELATVAAVVVAALVGGWLMYEVGHALGPQDPTLLAQGAERGTVLPDDLTLGGVDHRPRFHALDPAVVLAFPGGALLGLAAVALTTDGWARRRRRRSTR